MVAAGDMSNGRFKEFQKALGWNFNERSILFDATLRPALLRALRKDWMHGEVQHGAFNTEVALFLQSCERKLGEIAGRPMDVHFWHEVTVFSCSHAGPWSPSSGPACVSARAAHAI